MSETLFKQVNYTLRSLVEFIELGQIGLPDIQRPFVWKNAKVRDLFDSMYKGYPVGYLLLWQNAYADDSKTIGTNAKQKTPDLLIVDGQQRLTSIYAVLRGISVVRADYSSGPISIAFNPLDANFEVADAAIRKNRSFIPNISTVWDGSMDLFDLVDQYLEGLRATREVTKEEVQAIKAAITKLYGLISYPFTALELAASIDEEQVADVFVRINSKGTPLNQADFILTLMSVFWDEGRAELEAFSRAARVQTKGTPSPYNHFIEPSPDQLLRASVGLGFKRARLQYVYSILRGKDLETGEFSAERRDEQFEVLRNAQERVLNLTYWHDFLSTIRLSGYTGGRFISSRNNLIFAYILYLMGRTEYDVPEPELRQAISQWFFMSSLTGRYTGSPESAMEFDLARFRRVQNGAEFIAVLRYVSDSTLPDDFWAISLPNEMATSSPRSPSLFAYYASLILLEARGLFSKQKIADLLDPSVHGTRALAERHHLFPKGHLKTLGITDVRETNQIANYALLEWGDNVAISDSGPSDYVPTMTGRVTPAELRSMCHWHALPDGWESMEYDDFLQRRRELISKVIEEAYNGLREVTGSTWTEGEFTPLIALVADGESTQVEFKSTLRRNLHTGEKDPRIEHSALKTIVGFLNAHGGTLVIGVTDDGTVLGVDADLFQNEDKMHLHLVNLLRDRVGPTHMMYIHPVFEELDGKRVLRVECWKARSPAVLKDGKDERFFVRTGAATTELKMSEAQEFIHHRFGG